jgi:hypothetical protein
MMIVVFIGFFGVAGFLPLHSPSMDAVTIADIYRDHPVRIRFGFVIVMFGVMLLLPFGAALSQQISRFEKRFGFLSIAAALGSYALAMFAFYAAIWWLVTAFRPTRNPELTQAFNDSAWLQFVGAASLCVPLFVCPAIAAFADGSPDPLYPRYVGWFTALVTFSAVPCSQFAFYFHTGPGAWNGIVSFWIPFVDIAAWFAMMAYVMIKAARVPAPPDDAHVTVVASGAA